MIYLIEISVKPHLYHDPIISSYFISKPSSNKLHVIIIKIIFIRSRKNKNSFQPSEFFSDKTSQYRCAVKHKHATAFKIIVDIDANSTHCYKYRLVARKTSAGEWILCCLLNALFNWIQKKRGEEANNRARSKHIVAAPECDNQIRLFLGCI